MNKKNIFPFRSPGDVSLLSGGLSALLGLVVLAGWHTHTRALIQVNPAFVPMQYNTALGFLFGGIGILALQRRWPRFASVCGAVVATIGLVTLAQYLFDLDFGLDQLFMEHYITVETSHPGRMAPNTALSFSLVGVALLLIVNTPRFLRKSTVAGIGGFFVFALGVVALFGYFSGIETAYGWGQLTRMAVHTAMGFAVIGAGFLALAWHRQRLENASSFRLGGLTGVGMAIVVMLLWQALLVHHQLEIERVVEMQSAGARSHLIDSLELRSLLPTLTLIVGLVMSLMLAILVHLLQQTRVANVRLRAEVEERRQAEKELRQLGRAIEQSSEAICITDAEARMQYVNPAFEEMTGYRREEVIGRNPRILKSGKHDAAFYRDLWGTLAGGRDWTGRLINRRKDGTLYTEETTISPVHSEAGELVSYVALRRDVTAELELENELRRAQKMDSIGRLAGGVAHDFNNMLTPIMGYVEMLLIETPAEHPEARRLLQIHGAVNRASDLTAKLLAIGRRQTLEPQVIDLNKAIFSLHEVLVSAIREDIEFRLALAPGLGRLKADVTQLEQIVMNLVMNAQDAMSEGGILSIETTDLALDEAAARKHPDLEPGPYVVLAVNDTGCGMDDETLRHIFEPFFTSKQPGRGTGLGLAAVYGIVKQHHGTIEVTSELGRGTRFEIYLPQAERRFESAAQAGVFSPIAGKHGSETILLSEDDQAVRDFTREVLEEHGYRVIAPESPAGTLEASRAYAGKIDLLLTDVIMPGMNGKQVYEKIGEMRPEIKVLYMSGHPDDVIASRGVVHDGVHFIKKPFSIYALTEKIRTVLEVCLGDGAVADGGPSTRR